MTITISDKHCTYSRGRSSRAAVDRPQVRGVTDLLEAGCPGSLCSHGKEPVLVVDCLGTHLAHGKELALVLDRLDAHLVAKLSTHCTFGEPA